MPRRIADLKKARSILRVLSTYQRPMTTSEIAEKTGMARPTVQKNLNFLHKKHLVQKKKIGARIKWGV